MKHSCINCAFCIHCQNKITLVESSIFQDKKEKLLTDDERKSAKENNFSFIGNEKNQKLELNEKKDKNINKKININIENNNYQIKDILKLPISLESLKLLLNFSAKFFK